MYGRFNRGTYHAGPQATWAAPDRIASYYGMGLGCCGTNKNEVVDYSGMGQVPVSTHALGFGTGPTVFDDVVTPTAPTAPPKSPWQVRTAGTPAQDAVTTAHRHAEAADRETGKELGRRAMAELARKQTQWAIERHQEIVAMANADGDVERAQRHNDVVTHLRQVLNGWKEAAQAGERNYARYHKALVQAISVLSEKHPELAAKFSERLRARQEQNQRRTMPPDLSKFSKRYQALDAIDQSTIEAKTHKALNNNAGLEGMGFGFYGQVDSGTSVTLNDQAIDKEALAAEALANAVAATAEGRLHDAHTYAIKASSLLKEAKALREASDAKNEMPPGLEDSLAASRGMWEQMTPTSKMAVIGGGVLGIVILTKMFL
jgi:hypothetical protein